MTRLHNVSLRHASLGMLCLVAMLLTVFVLLTWNVLRQSHGALAELERLNVQQASNLNRLHIASLEGLNRLDRALERQLRPSLGDPDQALEAVVEEFAEMRDAHARFMAAEHTPEQAPLRDSLDERYRMLMSAMEAQLAAIQSGDRGAYRQLTLESIELSQALTETARDFYEEADRHGIDLLTHAGQRARLFSSLLLVGALSAMALLAGLAWVGYRQVILPLRHIMEHFRRIAAGDLTTPVIQRGRNEIGQLFGELERMQDSLATMANQLGDSSHRVLDSAQQLATGNQELAARTGQQSSSLIQTTASLDELTVTVGDNAEHARQVSLLSEKAIGEARQGADDVADLVATMEGIHRQSQRIDDIVELIDNIAFQTNILALNASVEAARAGEHGRGFAVVAGEVRALASRSAEAAHDIRELIGDSRNRIEAGHQGSERASRSMRNIVDAIAEVSTLMEQISRASDEQRHGIERLNHTMAQLGSVAQQNVLLVEEASQSAAVLEREAWRMSDLASRFSTSPPDVTALPSAHAQQPANRVALPAEEPAMA